MSVEKGRKSYAASMNLDKAYDRVDREFSYRSGSETRLCDVRHGCLISLWMVV